MGTEGAESTLWGLALELVDGTRQFAHRDSEGFGDGVDGAPGWIRPAPLDQRDGAGREASVLGEAFLGDAALLAELPHGLSERGLGLVWASHRIDTLSKPGEVRHAKPG